MSSRILDRIVRESGVPDLVEILAERLSTSDLQSLLLEVQRRRAAAGSVGSLVDRYAKSRFTRPARVPPGRLLELDRLALSLLPAGFEAVELSPLPARVAFYVRLVRAWCERAGAVGRVRVPVTPLPAGPGAELLEDRVLAPLAREFDDVAFAIEPGRRQGRGYYRSVCFHVYADDAHGSPVQLADGGFTAWTQELVGSRKERLLVSGLGSERLAGLAAS